MPGLFSGKVIQYYLKIKDLTLKKKGEKISEKNTRLFSKSNCNSS